MDPYEKLEADMDPGLTQLEVVLELLILRVEAQLKTTPTVVPPFEVSLLCAVVAVRSLEGEGDYG